MLNEEELIELAAEAIRLANGDEDLAIALLERTAEREPKLLISMALYGASAIDRAFNQKRERATL